jgi:hypothetical protein
MFDTDTILWSILFGAIGMGYFVYGKNEKKFVPLVCGVSLCAFPYFVSSVLWTLLIGIALTLAPWFIKTD